MDKKEAKSAYKNAQRAMGIYQIRNTVNGRLLVGSSMDLDGRRNRFSFEARNGTCSKSRAFLADWQAHGPAAFVFEVLEIYKPREDAPEDPKEELGVLEQLWVEKLQPFGERGYNPAPLFQ